GREGQPGRRGLHDHRLERGLPEAPREPAGERHAAVLRGQAQGRRQPDAGDEAAEALRPGGLIRRMGAGRPLPLEGVRVLDLTRLLPGPFASLVLADLGATVDKVEDPGGGDYLRHMPPAMAGANA